jgi:hypothetical protein
MSVPPECGRRCLLRASPFAAMFVHFSPVGRSGRNKTAFGTGYKQQ